MIRKYLEVDSTYRNRRVWPLQAHFEVENTRPTYDEDPIAYSMPIVSWQGSNVAVAGTVVSSTTNSVIFTAVGLPTELDYDTHAIFTPPGTRITSYKYLGSNQAQVTLETPMAAALAVATPVTISDPTDLSLLRLFVPGGSNYYVGKLLYDETVGGYATITSYDNGVITVSNAIPGWNVTDSFSIRTDIPSETGTTGALSTTNTVVGVTAAQVGSFVRLLPTYPTVAPAGEVRRIVAYDSMIATVYPPFSASAALVPYEILPYSGSNVGNMVYSGNTQADCLNSTVRLLELMIPNQELGTGGKPTDYPYIYVRLTPRDSSNIHVNCSNNPNSINMLFRATYYNITSTPSTLPFVKFTGDDAAVRVRFNLDSELAFQLTLPTGQTIEFVKPDNSSPSVPNPLLQISALFEITRDFYPPVRK